MKQVTYADFFAAVSHEDTTCISVCENGKEMQFQRTRMGWYDGHLPHTESQFNQMLSDEFQKGTAIRITTMEGETIYGRVA